MMNLRLSAVQLSARVALATSFCFACSQTPPAEAPLQPEPAAAPEVLPPAPDKAVPAAIVIKDVGFQTPESVLHDPSSDTYLVSNINGAPLDKDDNGFISKLSPEGQVLQLKWIDASASDVQLNAPKGLGIANGKLYVADIDTVRTFDVASGKPLTQIKVAGASFLNDIAVGPDGTVYVSDTGLKASKAGLEPDKKDAIYKIDAKGAVSALIKGVQLNNPNGLSADATGLWVATWQGGIYRVTPDGKQEATLQAPGAQLDGLVQTADGQVLVSSWEKSTVFLGSADGQFSPLLADVQSPADIGYDSKRGQLLVPSFLGNSVQLQKLPQVSSAAASVAPPSDATAGAK
jgi:SMP-30/gluconolaconase/LRE-like protein